MNCVYGDIVPLIFLEDLRPKENVLYRVLGSGGSSTAVPVTFRRMLLSNRVPLGEDNWRLNGAGYAETVTTTIIGHGPSEDVVFKEMWKKRADKHVLFVNALCEAPCLEHGHPIFPKTIWNDIPSQFLPEKDSLYEHYFGGNIQHSVAPKQIANLEMEFKLAWNDEYLFVFAQVEDGSIVVREGNTCDGITLNFDIGGKVLQYGLFVSLKDGKAQIFKAFEQREWQPLDGAKAVTFCEICHGQGYRLEAAIPWSELELAPSVEKKLLFDIEVIDFRPELDTPHTILVWSGGRGLGWRFSDVFGTMILTDSTVFAQKNCI